MCFCLVGKTVLKCFPLPAPRRVAHFGNCPWGSSSLQVSIRRTPFGQRDPPACSDPSVERSATPSARSRLWRTRPIFLRLEIRQSTCPATAGHSFHRTRFLPTGNLERHFPLSSWIL